jgi:hypothetical protein
MKIKKNFIKLEFGLDLLATKVYCLHPACFTNSFNQQGFSQG